MGNITFSHSIQSADPRSNGSMPWWRCIVSSDSIVSWLYLFSPVLCCSALSPVLCHWKEWWPQTVGGAKYDISFVYLSAIVLSLWILVSKLCVIEFESQRITLYVVLIQKFQNILQMVLCWLLQPQCTRRNLSHSWQCKNGCYQCSKHNNNNISNYYNMMY